MYLLLVENNYISSREITILLDKNKIKCEIVNCSSSEALLDIAEKLSPDIVIIDFDFFIDDSADIVRELRKHSEEAYIFAFIDPDHYEILYEAIDEGIDDYLVKPLQREDIMLRIKIGLQRKTMQIEKPTAAVTRDQEINRKLLLDIADVFEKQTKEVEKTYFTSEHTRFRPEQLEEAGYSKIKYISDLKDLAAQDIPADEDILLDVFAEQEVPEKAEEDIYADGNDRFLLEPEPDLANDAEEVEEEHEDLIKTQADPDSFVIEYLSEPEESRAAFLEGSLGKIDDSDLFGMKQKENNLDSKSFEELFGSINDSGTRKGKMSFGIKVNKEKLGKVEYLFSAKKPVESEKDFGIS